jgi:hypothetical protein
MPITPPPTLATPPANAPSRADPATFAARGDAMMAYILAGLQPDMQAVSDWMEDTANTVESQTNDVLANETNINLVAGSIASVNTAAANLAAILDAPAQAAAAAASFDAFDDRYLGAKAVAPTLDNDGAALLTGALYFDTVLNSMRVWSGSAWSNTLVEVDDRILQDQQLLGGVEYATDLAGQALSELARVEITLTPLVDTNGTAIEQLALAITHALDMAGEAASAVAGGSVALEAGAATAPSLAPLADPATGMMFPATGVLALVTAGLERLRLSADGYLGLGTNAPTGLLDVNADKLRLRTAKTPASAIAAGNQGEVCWDTSYLYVCVSTNNWRRMALTTW